MRDVQMSLQFPRPGKVLTAVMVGLLCIWVMFAVAINYGGMSPDAFLMFAGNKTAILHGQVWRLFTAPLIHLPTGDGSVSHILFALLGFYFLAPALEERWGARRMIFFLVASGVLGFVAQLVGEMIFPKLAQAYWFGSYGVLEAIAVAWALGARGQSVYLFFVLPVSATGLLLFVIGFSILRVLGAEHPFEGLITPFGGMLAGWIFGAGATSPARRLWLKARYAWIQRRAARYRASHGNLRVIDGGGDRRKPGDKRFLN
jgi:membrane associated rhomboid family serine protease